MAEKVFLRFSHIGVAVPSIEQAVVTYQAIFGYVVTAGPLFDPIQNVYVCFLSCGWGDLELVEPAGEDSPVRSPGKGDRRVSYLLRGGESGRCPCLGSVERLYSHQ